MLLRAGGKRNELPYVAKVAQLWENPEDGECICCLISEMKFKVCLIIRRDDDVTFLVLPTGAYRARSSGKRRQ